MSKRPNPRAPSCPHRAPLRSGSLHRIPVVLPSSLTAPDSTSTTLTIPSAIQRTRRSLSADRASTAAFVAGSQLLRWPHRAVRPASPTTSSSSDSDDDLPALTMARPQIKFLSPPIFKASPSEDALEWIGRYETTGNYNGWGVAEFRQYCGMYFDGAARKWFLCSTLPTLWVDTPAGVDANGVATAAVIGFRTHFLKEFQQDNYQLFQETRLRSRVQGIDEPTNNYYYDILDLCRIVDPAMSEANRLEYLYRGLRPSLLEKVYPMRPLTVADFLSAVKVHTEAALMAHRHDWSDTVLSGTPRPQPAAQLPVAAVSQDHGPLLPELVKLIKSLQISVEKLQEPKSVGFPSQTHGRGLRDRSPTGTPVCSFCDRRGHIARACFRNPDSEFYGMTYSAFRNRENLPPTPTRPTAPAHPSAPILNMNVVSESMPAVHSPATLPILHVDFSRLVTEVVECGAASVLAVVDTGAAVTVISPQFLEKTRFRSRPWNGPRIIMANGSPSHPIGSAHIIITHRNGSASGEAVVMGMTGIDLLLGNDFLKQFGKVRIDYNDPRPLLTLGDLPLNAIHPHPNPTTQGIGKLVTATNLEIPAFSVIPVATVLTFCPPGPLLLEPSATLLASQSLSAGHALVPDNCSFIPVANLSPHPVWIGEGVSLGTLRTCTASDSVIPMVCDQRDTLPINGVSIHPSEVAEPEEPIALLRDKVRRQINPDISADQQQQIMEVLLDYIHCFATDEEEMGKCKVAEHVINTGASRPVHQPPYKSAWKEREVVQDQVNEMLRKGIIEHSDSPWCAPVVLVKKKDGGWRFCVDYRRLNEVTVKDAYPLPRIADALSRLEGSKFFSIMDLQSGYHQVPLRDSDRPKSAFVTADGLFQFKVMPFGLTNAPGTFQRAMDLILAGLRWSACLVYLDDVVVYSPTLEQHLVRLKLVLTCFAKAGLKLKWTKCHFAQTSLRVLGHVVSKDGIGPDPDKLEAVNDFPSPAVGRNHGDQVKRIQSFLGLCSYYRRHIRNFAMVARPMTQLTKNGIPFQWGPEEERSFADLKKALTSAPVLAHPNYLLPMEIIPDACGYGIGGVLAQKIDGVEHPIAYASRLLTASEINYSITEKECLALVWCLIKFRSFVWGCPITVITDHQALCWLMTKKDLAGRLARWSLSLQEYDIRIVYRNGKLHDNADCLSRNPLLPPEDQLEDRCVLFGAVTEEPLLPTDKWDIQREQRKDPKWHSIIALLEQGVRTNPKYIIRDGRLHIARFYEGKTALRLCLPRLFRHQVLLAYHDDVLSGHMGITRTLTKIAQRFYWPKMALDVYRHVQTCQSCQGRKGVPKKPAGKLLSIKVDRPFEKVGIDLLGPFPLSKKGKRYIIVAVDYLTKWVEVQALPTGKANGVAEFFVNQIFLRHGAPEQIITDRGKCFIADLTQEVAKKLQTNHKTTSAYHPQANGQVERMNHTLADMLSMYVSSHHKDWDETLHYVCFAYNTARQDSTGFSPFFLLYGREPILPIDLALGADPNPLLDATREDLEHASRLLFDLASARELVQLRLRQAKNKQKTAFDSGRRELSFNTGDLVLVYKPVRKVGLVSKLLHRWLGPFRVIRKTTAVNYEIIRESGRGKTDIVHVERMKRYFEAQPPIEVPLTAPMTLPMDEDPGVMARPVLPPSIPVPSSRAENLLPEEDDPITPVVLQPHQPDPTQSPEPPLELPPNSRVRPQRTRRTPERYAAALLPYMACVLALLAPATVSSIVVSDNAFFLERPGVAFSESSWTIVTEINFTPAEDAIRYLEQNLREQITFAAAGRLAPSRLRRLAGDRQEKKTNIFLDTLKTLKSRFTALHLTFSGTIRDRRAMVDAGGHALKWLFGVATQTDLESINGLVSGLTHRQQEVVHVLDRQATVVNESLWEIRTNTRLILDLKKQYQDLRDVTRTLLVRSMDYVEYEVLEYFLHLDTALDGVAALLQWLTQYINNLDVGLSALAGGRLGPQIFPPAQLQTVLNAISTKLPLGWTFASSELWDVYRDAPVSVAAFGRRFRIFVRVPIFDHTQRFTLYQTLSLPRSTDNGKHGVIFGNLPDYLAVSLDLETFIELTQAEVTSCRGHPQPLCRFHAGIGKRAARTSCAMSLFMHDENRTLHHCQRKFQDWGGTEVAYLGDNRWAFSAAGPHDVVISCPEGAGQPLSRPLRLPAVGFFEVPASCNARTNDWILPASIEGQTEFTLQSARAPSLHLAPILKIGFNESNHHAIFELPQGNTSAWNLISDLLNRNSLASASAEMTGQQIQHLLTEPLPTPPLPMARYPFELVTGILLITILILAIGCRLRQLTSRMTAHERMEEPLYHEEATPLDTIVSQKPIETI